MSSCCSRDNCCGLNCNAERPASFVANNPRCSTATLRCCFPLANCSAKGSEGQSILKRIEDWDVPLMSSMSVQNFYDNYPVLSRIIAFPINVAKGGLKFCTTRVIDAIGTVVFPIIAMIKWDKNYLYAAAYAFIGTLFTAALIGIYFLNPSAAINMAITFAAFRGLYEGVKAMFPRTFVNYNPTTEGWHAACS